MDLLNKMTTEDLTTMLETFIIRFEECTDTKEMNSIIRSIERIEKIRDMKSWS